MKNVFFSILVVFMLAFSMLGNIDLISAQPIVSLESLDYDPDFAIKGINNRVGVSFNIVNTGNQPAVVTAITTTRPNKEGSGFLDIPEGIIFQEEVQAQDDQSINFPVTGINVDTVAGNYNAVITVDIEGQEPQTLSYSINVQDSNPSVSSSVTELVITSEEESVKTKEFTLTNSGNRNLNELTLKIEGGTFSDGTEIISFRAKFGNDVFRNVVLNTPLEMASDMNVGSSSIVVIEATIPQNINLDNYAGRIIIADTQFAQATVTIPLTIRIEPEICKDGRLSNGVVVDGPQTGDLRISIDNPDNNDDFKILDDIEIDGDVENKGSTDLDVVIEAILYDLDNNNEILTIESDSIEVDDGQSEGYDLIMQIPNDEDIDPDNTYMLYIKAYDDGNEDEFCNYDSIEVDLERDDDHVIMTSFTINPIVVQQERSVSFRVGVENIGTDDQRDSYIIVRNEELGLELRSNVFDLKKYDKSGNDYIFTQTFTIPANAEEKDYTIEAVVYYNNERDTASSFGTLTVQDNGQKEEEIVTPPTTGPGTYTPTGASIFSSLDSTKTLFIIGDIILVILAILFLILIFKKK